MLVRSHCHALTLQLQWHLRQQACFYQWEARAHIFSPSTSVGFLYQSEAKSKDIASRLRCASRLLVCWFLAVFVWANLSSEDVVTVHACRKQSTVPQCCECRIRCPCHLHALCHPWFDLLWIEHEHSVLTLETTHNIILATRGMRAVFWDSAIQFWPRVLRGTVVLELHRCFSCCAALCSVQ